MKNIIFIIGFILFCILIILYINFDSSKSYFSNYQSVMDSGLMKKGWIPSWIPSSSLNINEIHNLDTNKIKLYFDIPKNSINLMLSEAPCKKINSNFIINNIKNIEIDKVNIYECDHYINYRNSSLKMKAFLLINMQSTSKSNFTRNFYWTEP